MGDLWIGTSGYSYDDWHGPFYPVDLPRSERLAWYAREFGCTGINSTYYRQPSLSLTRGLQQKAPGGFRFTFKAYGGITHGWERCTAVDLRRFEVGLEPLTEAGQIGCVLAQFPPSFRPTRAATDHLRRLAESWTGWPVVVEFRQAAWA